MPIVARRTQCLFLHRPRLFFSSFLKIRRCSSIAAVASPSEQVKLPKEEEGHLPASYRSRKNGDSKTSEWKKLDSKELGISNSMIAGPTRMVLNGLRKKGYEVYLVGGCVRDLILKRVPKDFDIITSAELNEIRKSFRRCEIVGKRFPICHVRVGDTIVEVSSFSTSASKSGVKFKHDFRRPPGCSEHDFLRWRNCLRRDFTINGLMFDPYANVVYDYLGGMEDLKKTKVRTVIPANVSFAEDNARILRAIRIAARLGFHLSREVAVCLKEFSSSVLRLDKGRILMELNYMFAYGSAEASLRLLWRFGLLEILLPIQASYFVSQGFQRRDKRSNMLLSLFSNLDKLVAPDQPCHTILWISIFALHKAVVDKPEDPSVIAAFSLAVNSGGSLRESVEIVRRIPIPHEGKFHELSERQELGVEALMDEVIKFSASVKASLSKMSDAYFVSQAMAKYPQAPYSDLIFIPAAMSSRVCKIFECVTRGMGDGFVAKCGRKIQSESLAMGSLPEIRHAFARIIFDTVYPPDQSGNKFLASRNQS
ncbi:hypothetical protein K2173_005787 [Erythroxylum novogranatense]|uniref:Polynucleotide adenylyltransferase n=1 Tax=Erythroxylum novogranatense TaxID=1862640 RepID=A0AAV8U2N7_9ROSI|nr:hypothetical protein K2173_005787 [Erythroxylum novogranatense]